MDDSGSQSFNLEAANEALVQCFRCPRLVEWRERVAKEKRKSFADEDYWGRPIPHFGDPNADRLIVGLAPAAHGGNRTGRIFTGDRSGDWLFRALWKAGVANQPTSVHRGDGLEVRGVLITAAVHCAPPDNKPLPSEFANCQPYFEELFHSRRWQSILCLGSIAWNQLHRVANEKPKVSFAHGAASTLKSGAKVVGSYHPSQQNTFTGRLTETMLDTAIREFLS